MLNKTNVHTIYQLASGDVAPSVTTILSILEKPGVHYWIANVTKAGEDWEEVRDAAGRVGTLAHDLIACHLAKRGVGMVGYSPVEVEKAERCFAKYLQWEKEHPLSPVMIETPLVSELFKYGGTPDLLAEIDGKFVLIDFKTGGGIYDSYFCQLAAYRKLLEEQGWTVAGARIVRISPDENDRIEVAMALDLDRNFEKFKHALAIWQLDNGGEKERR